MISQATLKKAVVGRKVLVDSNIIFITNDKHFKTALQHNLLLSFDP